MVCRREEQAKGGPYPRTCPECGLSGSCRRTAHNPELAKAEINRLRKELAELKGMPDSKKVAEWPQVGEGYFFIASDGRVDWYVWGNNPLIDEEKRNHPLGIFKTRQEAEEAAGKIRRVMEHLRAGKQIHLMARNDIMAEIEEVVSL